MKPFPYPNGTSATSSKLRCFKSCRSAAFNGIRGLAFALSVTLLCAALSTLPTHANPLQTHRRGIVNIGVASNMDGQVGVRWLGSGFLADKSCRVVTAKHVVDSVPDGNLVVRFPGAGAGAVTHTHSARVVAVSSEADIAVLQFLGGRGTKLCRSKEFEPFTLAKSGERSLLSGEPVFVVGFPMLEGEAPRDVPILRAGYVASAELDWDNRAMLLLDLTGVPGFSGSPVVLKSTGEVIGVVFGPGRTRREYDLEWATPLSVSTLSELLSAN